MEIYTSSKKSSPRTLSLWHHDVNRNFTHNLVTKFIGSSVTSGTIVTSHKSCQKCLKGFPIKQYLNINSEVQLQNIFLSSFCTMWHLCIDGKFLGMLYLLVVESSKIKKKTNIKILLDLIFN